VDNARYEEAERQDKVEAERRVAADLDQHRERRDEERQNDEEDVAS